MSYFVGGKNFTGGYDEDGGFAINGGEGWGEVVFTNHVIYTWATIPLDWIMTRPESVSSTFHGASTPIRDYRWVLQVLHSYPKWRCRS